MFKYLYDVCAYTRTQVTSTNDEAYLIAWNSHDRLKTTSNNYHRCGDWTWQLWPPYITGSHGNPAAWAQLFRAPPTSWTGHRSVLEIALINLDCTYTRERRNWGRGEEGSRDREKKRQIDREGKRERGGRGDLSLLGNLIAAHLWIVLHFFRRTSRSPC